MTKHPLQTDIDEEDVLAFFLAEYDTASVEVEAERAYASFASRGGGLGLGAHVEGGVVGHVIRGILTKIIEIPSSRRQPENEDARQAVIDRIALVADKARKELGLSERYIPISVLIREAIAHQHMVDMLNRSIISHLEPLSLLTGPDRRQIYQSPRSDEVGRIIAEGAGLIEGKPLDATEAAYAIPQGQIDSIISQLKLG